MHSCLCGASLRHHALLRCSGLHGQFLLLQHHRPQVSSHTMNHSVYTVTCILQQNQDPEEVEPVLHLSWHAWTGTQLCCCSKNLDYWRPRIALTVHVIVQVSQSRTTLGLNVHTDPCHTKGLLPVPRKWSGLCELCHLKNPLLCKLHLFSAKHFLCSGAREHDSHCRFLFNSEML